MRNPKSGVSPVFGRARPASAGLRLLRPSALVVATMALSLVTVFAAQPAGASTTQSASKTFTKPAIKATSGASLWKVQNTPAFRVKEAGFNSISCISSSDCVAVGFRLNGAADDVALAELWNGTNWRSMKGATPSGAENSELLSVSCFSAADCVAVGDTDGGALAELWNGISWTVEDVPTTAAISFLEGVSCASADQCMAVGYALTIKQENFEELAFAESWNGAAWTQTKVPKVAGATTESFASVSCVSPGTCEAVGNYPNESGEIATLAESWTGTSWVVQPTPATGSSQSQLKAVSCSSASECIAVGESLPDTLTESWNGTRWSIVASPNPANSDGSALIAVSCTATTACMAVGDYASSSGTYAPLAMSFNGASWTIQPPLNPSTIDAGLFGVSCTSQSSCTAVGGSVSTKNPGLLLVEVWDGSTWSTQRPFQKRTALGSALDSVSCVSASFCMSVGTDEIDDPIADIWNGGSWKSTPAPAGNGGGGMFGVTCLTTTNCIAVGGSAIATDTDGLAEQWNGKVWTIMQMPPGDGELESVSCTSATACIAIGIEIGESGPAPLAESWNGTTWSVMTLPSLGAGSNETELNAISCSSPNSCVAVGVSETSEDTDLPIIVSWNGTVWSTENSAKISSTALDLTGVACTSAGCMATGYDLDRIGSPEAYSEFSSGTTWTSIKMPSPSGGVELYGLQCSTSDACITVGGGIKGALAESWNGKAWSAENVVNPPGSGSSTFLYGVDCLSTTACTAVGDYTNKSGAEFTLAEAN